MLKMKRHEAFAKMTKLFGPWNMWGRAEHIAYGLARGVPYAAMESSANDNPNAVMWKHVLWKLGAFEEHPYVEGGYLPQALYSLHDDLVVWVKKNPRVKRDKEEAAE